MPKTYPELDSWVALNAAMKKATLARCEELLQYEKDTRRRKMFLLRIHSRLNRVRAHKEREALKKIAR